MPVLNQLCWDLLEFLRSNHNGADKYAPSSEIERVFRIKGASVRQVINKLRCRGYPVCSDANGYFYAQSQSEIVSTIAQLLSRTRKINEAVHGLILSQQVEYGEWEG